MCGIAGAFALAPGAAVPAGRAAEMAATLAHRGPDHAGAFESAAAQLGFRRLAILDLSPAGNQPHRAGDVLSMLNGEVYNFRALRAELEAAGVRVESTGDAALIPHLYRRFGDAFLEKLEGMFALAVLDLGRRRLLLARDRFGKKPIVYRVRDGVLEFGSEIKALLAGGAPVPEPDAAALSRYLCFGYVPGAASAFSGVRRLPPGHRLIADASGVAVAPWYVQPDVETRRDVPVDQWAREVFDSLVAATRARLVADVPVGIFLSGGIDSGLVLAAARAAGAEDVATFTIGFDDAAYDERPLAAATAARFGARAFVEVAAPDPAGALDAVASRYDEPFGDSSALPTLLLSRFARGHVKVALAGDGGDECFAGYRRHRALALSQKVERALPAALLRRLAQGLGEAANGVAGRGGFGALQRFAAPLALPLPLRNLYWSTWFTAPLRARFFHPEFRERAAGADPEGEAARRFESLPGSPLQRALRLDREQYLPDDLLVKTDVASMAFGLEVRCPFLDRPLVERAAAIPDDVLLRDGETKFVLRALAREHLPAEVASARKRGFGVPMAAWLRGPLRDAANAMLLSERFAARRILRDGAAAELLARHAGGSEDWSTYLWLLMMLEAWFRRFE